MIFLHGWHDSVNAADQLAREAVQNGFKVIAYDHRGHGNDSQRQQRGISTDLLRIDFRNFLSYVLEKYPQAEIAIAGHSMGGAILTSEHSFINTCTHQDGNKAVKSVSLFAPAVMSGIHKMISPFKLLYRNMHSDVQSAQQASNRFGGKGPSLISLLNFMRKAAYALSYLFMDVHSHHANWHIYSGKKDASVNYTEFESLMCATHQKKVSFFSRSDHALQFGRYSGTVIRTMLKDIEPCFNPLDNHGTHFAI